MPDELGRFPTPQKYRGDDWRNIAITLIDRGFERKRLWLLKNSFQGILTAKFVRKLLNVRLS